MIRTKFAILVLFVMLLPSLIAGAASAARPIDRALMDAVTSSDALKAESLLKRGADANARDEHGEVPLHSAAWNGSVEIAALLAANGADVNARNSLGETPLYIAAYYGKTAVMRLLIEKGADVNSKSASGETPLHRAALQGRDEAAKLLVENGADVNARAVPLPPVKTLSKLKAKVMAKLRPKREGATPLSYAKKKGSETIIQLLKEHGADD